jgi:4-carboxymuconolactone decarboxylase
MTAHRLAFRFVALVLLAAGASTAVAQTASSLPADLDAKSLARLPYLARQDLGDAGQKLADIFLRNGKPSDPLTGPLAFAAYNLAVANALLDLHDGAVGKGSLNPHVRELAILVACRETNYNLEWNGHEQAALKAGVDAKVIDVVRKGGSLAGLDDADAAVIRFGRELIGDRKMSSATFAKAAQLYGKNGAMDLVAVMSTYAVSGFYAIAVDEHMPAGKPMLPPLAK